MSVYFYEPNYVFEKNIVAASFELPGLKKEDVGIEVRDGRITITGESKISSHHEEEGSAVKERKFSRTLSFLPQGVKEEQINVSLKNGVLTVTFPKAIVCAEKDCDILNP